MKKVLFYIWVPFWGIFAVISIIFLAIGAGFMAVVYLGNNYFEEDV